VGDTIDTAALAGRLISYGYTRVPKVQLHGEFTIRGEVLDILMGGDDEAYRVLLDFEKVETIRRFDPIDQSSPQGREKIPGFSIRPLREVVWTDDRIEALGNTLGELEEFTQGGAAILETLMERKSCAGEEMFYPLAFAAATGLASMADYLEDMPVFFFDRERLENAQEAIEREYENLYRQACREEDGREVPSPRRILLKFKDLAARVPRSVSFLAIKGGGDEGAVHIEIPCEPSRSFFGNIIYLKEEFAALLKEGWKILVAAESDIQAERIESLLADIAGDTLAVTAAPLSAGFSLQDIRFMLVQENEIFGRRKRVPKSVKTVRGAAIDSFVELNPGDYVVHLNYGIGLFKGIERIKALGHERDYIRLEYLGDETVFVPIEQVNLVQRYIGNEGNIPRLDKLGSKSWEARKGRVKKSVEDIAEKLIALYSKRKAAMGFAFPPDTEWQTMFEAAFPFDETEDQLRCVEEIKQDMETPHPMDRLVCGDVGYGKTEVAVRACFKAVMGGKQVAFLAPTTILAEQHYENFQERFSRFPVKLAMLSRFVDRGTIKKALEDLKQGQVDILVGTHRIIQKDVSFKNLGLMVIDEEQRFGVKDKERLKELKTNVDCLTLSATPIPRTLHMSLLKIRDMSLLATPPQNRHPIETVIEEWNEDRIAAAIRREVERGGQIFFLHNRVESLNETRIKIEHLVPEMLVETAHGQMDGQDLEDVMHRFIHGGFHVLVSTTIIENGIDIPNVNTIIIDRADMYGVSQLYQLRGRVGRSDRVAHAYLFYPHDKSLSEVAMKRLQVISDFTELGSGFKIAMKDMEIRGAGNLLGREQSGDIFSVGFDLYLHLLDEAIRRLEDENYEGETETLLELEYTGFIPEAYIDSAQEKMEVYKKIASVREKEELERVYAEMLDRFGPLPDEAASLLSLAEIRIICRDIAVASLRERGGVVRVEFAKVAKVKVDRLVRMMKESAGKVKLDPKAPNVLVLHTGNIGLKEKSEFIREKLAALAG
jgi:transcription-repair coupling factor (superfamily II helicase)